MMITGVKEPSSDNASLPYSVAAFNKVAIEYGNIEKDLPKNLEAWKETPKTWQIRHGNRELHAPALWPATDYADFFACFGASREVLLVANGLFATAGGSSVFVSWRILDLVPTNMENSDQNNLIEFLEAQLPSSLTEARMEFTVVDALKERMPCLDFPYSWSSWRDMTERHL
ncbi:hypothetical protein LSUE1_G004749 [Lachnellula suecica]|uniref:Uncharacterized protein n=1 Tax=Lachnellula suecica TaxID=602035 RepID=A0A8T9C5Y2_9HELO|nr:hypothetical protein LSUE1_G004749 [Lachnellula suecica]